MSAFCQHIFNKSILALVLFKINGELSASWNNGDAVQSRFIPAMETSLLQILARSLSDHLDRLI